MSSLYFLPSGTLGPPNPSPRDPSPPPKRSVTEGFWRSRCQGEPRSISDFPYREYLRIRRIRLAHREYLQDRPEFVETWVRDPGFPFPPR